MAVSWFSAFDERLTTYFPLPVGVCSTDSEEGSWFLSPSQHLIESALFIAISSIAMVVCGRKFLRQLRKEEREAAEAGIALREPTPPSMLVRFFDVLLTAVLFVSICTIVMHKWNGINKMPYLLQPCHILHVLLLYILSLPRGSKQGAILLSIYLHELSAPFFGTVAADLTCYKQRFEAMNWLVQHGMLQIVPLYILATRRFGERVHKGASLFFFSFALMTFLHFILLVPVSILTATNLNYVMCAPPALETLPFSLGVHYRLPMIVAFGMLAWVLRYVVVDAFLRCVVDRKKYHEKAQIKPVGASQDEINSSSNKDVPQQSQEGLRKRN